MKITVRPLKGEALQVEIEGSAKVSDLKKKVAEAKAEFPAEQQKLVYQGKILQDDNTIQESNVTEDGFVVVMVTKPTAAPKAAAQPPAQPAAAPTAATTPAPAATAGGGAATTTANLPSVITDLRQNPRWSALAQRVVADPPSLPRMLASLRPQYPQLLQALTENLPGFVQMCRDEVGVGAGGAGAGAGGAFPAMPGAGGMGGMPGMDSPQFRSIAAALAQNPQMLQQMAQSDPEFAAALQQNPQAVAQVLAMAAQGGGGGAGGQMPMQIELTADDEAAVGRLCALGFDREMVIEVYQGCGKDEVLAANILMDETQEMQDS